MKKYILAVSVCALVLFGCKKDVPHLAVKNELLKFEILTASNTEQIADNVICIIQDTLIAGVTGNNNGRATLVASFVSTGVTVSVNGIIQVSGETVNDFTMPVIYTVTAENGDQKRYTVKLKGFNGLPIMYLNPEAPVVSKDDYVNGTMKMDGNVEFTNGLFNGNIQIKGRGNSTWYVADKKSYKIKFSDKQGLLGLPADKEWAILANWFDKSLLRNDVAFELSERLKREWTPKRNFFDVFMNNEFQGNYLLSETIKAGKDRVNIDTKNGGYLIEFNAKPQEDDPRFYTGSGYNILAVDVKEGNIPIDNIKKQVDNIYYQLENSEFDPVTGYQKDFDLDAFVSWFIVNETMINHDAVFYSSVFLQKDNASGKLKMGPVWDFDFSSGNVSYGQVSPEGWYLMKGNIVNYIWTDSLFQAALKVKWNQYKSQILSLPDYISQQSRYLNSSANQNFKRWDILSVNIFPNVVVTGSYNGEVDYFKSWLSSRIAWMDKEINK